MRLASARSCYLISLALSQQEVLRHSQSFQQRPAWMRTDLVCRMESQPQFHLYNMLHFLSGIQARILRYAMVNFIFREEPAGHVRHTILSAHLAQTPAFCDFLRTIAMVFNPANTCIPLALSRFPDTRSMTQTAHNIARGTDQVFYEWLDANASLRDNFDRGMEGISRGGQRLQDTDLRAYPWNSLPESATIVDVGGSGRFQE
jgi:hypothetical protein